MTKTRQARWPAIVAALLTSSLPAFCQIRFNTPPVTPYGDIAVNESSGVAADLNEDGLPDLVVTGGSSGAVLLNRGNFSLVPPALLSSGH